MAQSFGNFIKDNAKFQYAGLGAPFALMDAKGILDSDNKFKALLKTMKDLLIARVAMIGMFTGIATAVKSLVRETGSLQAALTRMQGIQSLQRQLAPLVGGLSAAKQRMAELMVLSSRGPFKVEQVGAANVSLQSKTRGSYSDAHATQQIGKVALATGNDIEQVADAVGDFYEALRNGAPVDRATEQLRQMGIVSQATSDHLSKMAEGNIGTTETFTELTRAMAITAAGAKGYRDEISNITAEHEKAKEELAIAFGAPFAKSDVTSTKNMTAAFQAITPAVSEVSGFLEKLYNGFSTVGSAIAKWTAQTGLAGGAIKTFTGLIAAASVAALVYGTVALPAILTQVFRIPAAFLAAGRAIGLTGVALKALGGAGFATSLGALAGLATITIGGIVLLGSAIYTLSQQQREAQKRVEEWGKAHRDSISDLKAQAAAISSLTEKNEALSASVARVIALEKERSGLQGKIKKETKEAQTYSALTGRPSESTVSGKVVKALGFETREQAIARNTSESRQKLAITESSISQAKGIQDTISRTGAPGPEQQRLIAARAEIAKRKEESENVAGMIGATPEKRIELLEKQKGVIGKYEGQAIGGVEAGARVEQQRGDMQPKIAEQQEAVAASQRELAALSKEGDEHSRKGAKAKVRAEKDKLTKLQSEQIDIGSSAPETSATFLETKAEQMRQAKLANELDSRIKDKGWAPLEETKQISVAAREARSKSGGVQYDADQLQQLETQAKIARDRESNAPEFANRMKALQAEIDASKREMAIAKTRVDAEKEIADLKQEGPARAAEEYRIKQKQIDEELAIMRQQEEPDQVAIEALENQKKQNERSDQLRKRGTAEDREGIKLDIAQRQAERSGDSEKARSLSDEQDFAQKYSEMESKFGAGTEEAKSSALSLTAEDIKDQYKGFNVPVVASHMASIGGGGGTYAPSGDPALEASKRLVKLNELANEYLQKIAEQSGMGVK